MKKRYIVTVFLAVLFAIYMVMFTLRTDAAVESLQLQFATIKNEIITWSGNS
jgi:hypothetical protein